MKLSVYGLMVVFPATGHTPDARKCGIPSHIARPRRLMKPCPGEAGCSSILHGCSEAHLSTDIACYASKSANESNHVLEQHSLLTFHQQCPEGTRFEQESHASCMIKHVPCIS
eukprot:gnl/TRDRNA2_/TRDRNA2_204839_c0_seq1.p2 gnl/TRDRNA2_/TRDRNA2_204839_c0~~gnl/TRDRNA2_/TRDRNA2_204839_c0_seq1.p2  ORF type:complete len:113 (-),score=8.96 gnl/TRDRNA2_/TRDRNA2_204839_c0_seq1:155-493(-)